MFYILEHVRIKLYICFILIVSNCKIQKLSGLLPVLRYLILLRIYNVRFWVILGILDILRGLRVRSHVILFAQNVYFSVFDHINWVKTGFWSSSESKNGLKWITWLVDLRLHYPDGWSVKVFVLWRHFRTNKKIRSKQNCRMVQLSGRMYYP